MVVLALYKLSKGDTDVKSYVAAGLHCDFSLAPPYRDMLTDDP